MTRHIPLETIDAAMEKFSIPPRPDILKAIQKEVESPEPNIKNLAALIDHDKALTHFTLKVVNSPLFGLSREVKSIEHACNYLGIPKVCKLIQSILLRLTVSNGDERPFTSRIWNTASDVAMATALLAKEFEFDEAFCEDCYTLGQFHNAGMALAYKLEPTYSRVVKDAYVQTACTICDHEMHETTVSHEVLGYLIANKWMLPDVIVEVIAYHHNHELLLNSGVKAEEDMFALLKLAEHMTGMPQRLADAPVDHEWEKHGDAILEGLQIDRSHINHLNNVLNNAGVSTVY